MIAVQQKDAAVELENVYLCVLVKFVLKGPIAKPAIIVKSAPVWLL